MTISSGGERLEPKFAPSPAAESSPKPVRKRQAEPPAARIVHERRDERNHVRVRLPFDVIVDGKRFLGAEVSVGGFSVSGYSETNDARPVPVELAIRCNGFHASIDAEAILVEVSDDGTARFTFSRIGEPELLILRKIIRAHLAGTHLTIEQLAAEEDPQTLRNRVKKVESGPAPGLSTGRTILIFGIVLVLFTGFVAALVEKLYVIKPGFAAVTAPSIDIYAPIDGELSAHDLNPGQRVARDQQLVTVVDPEAQAQLVLAEATLHYNDRLLQNLQESLERPEDKGGTAFMSGGAASGGAPVLTKLTPLETRSRITELQSTHDFAVARIESLRARASTGTIHAPCDCLIQSIRSGEGGYWIQKGTLIAQLIKTGPEDVNVEALVHLDIIDQIEPNASATVVLPTTGESIEARVSAIQLQSQNIERAGFPEWARQDMSHGSVIVTTQEPLPPQFVGQPVEVRFLDTSSFGGQILAAAFRSLGDMYREWVSNEPPLDRTVEVPERNQ